MMMMMRVPSTRRTTIVPRASRLSSSKKKRSPTPASSKLKKTNELDVATGIGIEKLRTKNKSVVGVSTKKVSLPPHYPSEYKPGAAVVGGVFLATSLVTKYLTTGEAIGVSGLHRHPQKPAFLIGLLFGTQILLNVFDLSYLLPDGGFQSVQNSVRLGIAGWCVGVGSACAGGCTSGHAVSGIARLSKRSLVATSIFFMVGVITATVFDTAGAMNVVLMDSGIRTFTFDLFFDRMFTNADIIVPWVAAVSHTLFATAILALKFTSIAFPFISIVAGLYLYYRCVTGTDSWEENFERMCTIRETETKEEKQQRIYETYHVEKEKALPPIDLVSRGAFILCAFAWGFFAIAAAEAESAFHTSKLLLVWLSSLAFFAVVTLIGVYGENERLRKCTKSVANSVSGSLFGLSLCVGRMLDPATVSAFLSVTKNTFDPSLMVFLFVALAFSIPTFAYIKGWKSWNERESEYQDKGLQLKRSFFGDELAQPDKPNQPFEWRVLVGASIFGVGWGLAALCPGPMYGNLGAAVFDRSLRFDKGIGLFFAMFLAGQTLFRTLMHLLNNDGKINSTIVLENKKTLARLDKADTLEELRGQLSKALGHPSGENVESLAYSEGDRSIIPLTSDDDVLVMYATWESEKTSRDRKARLKFFVHKSEEKKKGEETPPKEANRMAPHGTEKKE